MANGERANVVVIKLGFEGFNQGVTIVVGPTAFVYLEETAQLGVFVGRATLSAPFRPREDNREVKTPLHPVGP